MRILIAEDDPVLAAGVAETVARMQLVPVVAADGHAAADLITAGGFDLAVLDIGLPGFDGLRLLEQIRRGSPRLPVILLTARDALEDRVRGLDLGADDYLVKPVAAAELAARIRARLRGAMLEAAEVLRLGPLRLDTMARVAHVGCAALELTSREWVLLEFLMRRLNRVVPKEQIQLGLGGREEPGYNAVEVYVSRLRAKLEPHGVRIRTIRGLGYRLEGPAEP